MEKDLIDRLIGAALGALICFLISCCTGDCRWLTRLIGLVF